MNAFAHPSFLWALVLALAPLLFHLWRHPALPPAIDFGATQLLAASAERLRRRARLHDWLLVATRTLLLISIVLAFAGPGAPPRVIRRPAHGTASPLAVGITADSREYLDAALGPTARQGESHLIFLGENSSPPAKQSWIRFGGIQTGAVSVAAAPYYHPALAVFDQPGEGDLSRVRAWRWWKLEPQENAFVIARFSNGDPFLVEHWTATARTILCAVPADLNGSDLPLHPNFVPLVRELVRYLGQPPPASATAVLSNQGGGKTLAGWLLGTALVLAVIEMLWTGMAVGKLGATLVLALALWHPAFPWPRARPARRPLAIIIDRTESMRFRAKALTRLLPGLPPGETVTLTGAVTPLGEALLALTNRPIAGAILLSDGQHNQGVSPAWAAAAVGVPVFTVAVGEPAAPADVAITALAAAALVFTGEQAMVRATITATGYRDPRLAVRITLLDQTLLATNLPASVVIPNEVRNLSAEEKARDSSQARNDKTLDFSLRFTPPRSGLYVLRVTPLPSEATTVANQRHFAVTVVPEKIRVCLEHGVANWEFLHVRHALARDAAVALVGTPAEADVVIAPSGQTWRLEALGQEMFQQFWSDRVRAEFLRVKHPRRIIAPPVSVEMAALWRNDSLLAEVARVSGGRFFTAATMDQLPAAIQASRPGARARLDLRDSWLALVAAAAGFIISWARRRASSETA